MKKYKVRVTRYFKAGKSWVLWDSEDITLDYKPKKEYLYIDQDTNCKCKDVVEFL